MEQVLKDVIKDRLLRLDSLKRQGLLPSMHPFSEEGGCYLFEGAGGESEDEITRLRIQCPYLPVLHEMGRTHHLGLEDADVCRWCLLQMHSKASHQRLLRAHPLDGGCVLELKAA